MILGLGTDIIEVARIAGIYAHFAEKFPERVLHEKEYVEFEALPKQEHAHFLAKRFSAKEAIAKAIGTGIGEMVAFGDIRIGHDDRGKPLVELSAAVNARIAALHGVDKIVLKFHLSVSDTSQHAYAVAILECTGND